jgi:hypothetical protein
MKEWFDSVAKWLTSNNKVSDAELLRRSSPSDYIAPGTPDPEPPSIVGGQQTGRVIKKPTRSKNLWQGEAGPEAVVPLDRDSRTRSMRNDLKGQNSNITVNPVEAQLSIDGIGFGKLLIKFDTKRIENSYGRVNVVPVGIS